MTDSKGDTKELLRASVRGVYDLQKLRIQMGNGIAANFRVRLGIAPSTKEEDSPDASAVLAMVRADYNRITDGILGLPPRKTFQQHEGVICTYAELQLVDGYVELETAEKKLFKSIQTTLKLAPIYTEWLSGVKGVGPAMAGVILSEIDIHRAKYASSLWRYAGLDVASDGQGRSRKAEHLVDYEYTDSNGEIKTRKGITFNPFLKTKLIGVLATSFLRSGNERYRKIYDDYKHRLENHPVHAEKTKGHRNNMALRYMIKQFLADLYREWRAIEGLTVHPPYSESKLDLKHEAA